MPIDAEPVANGNIVVDSVRALEYGRSDVEAARERGMPLRQHHRLSCPNAAQWARGSQHSGK
jgi:hypothetical protein